MADKKSGRDKQAQDADRRQRERDIDAELERGGETEPPVDAAELVELEAELEALEFPTTGAAIVASVGDHTISSAEGSYSIEDLVPATDEETFDSPDAVRVQVQRPTVAAAMKRIVEASDALPDEELDGSQYDAYERTFQELERVSPDDDDEAIAAIRDWVVDRIRDKEKLPTSRQIRRQAAKVCRQNGLQIRDDDWLGI